MFKSFLKFMLVSILGIIGIIALIAVLFVNLSPQFGGKHSSEAKARYAKSGIYKEGKFLNQIPTDMSMDFASLVSITKDFIKGVPNSAPDFEVPIHKVDSLDLTKKDTITKLIWFGHSAFLLQMDDKNILIDPMLGNVPSPHPWLGKGRYQKELPIEIEQLPVIDAIIISHDHYDHLDYGSIQKLKAKTKTFLVPLGVGAHFEAWGVPKENIHELNWWDEIKLDNIKLAFTPSRHFSGRGMGDRFSTLWGSWVITGSKDNIYFSGDGGYGPHFKEVGEKYGPFNFAMMECGQYNEKWADIHMMPEETVQAAIDVKSELFMPIHWGSFTLALHSWTDPVERVIAKANELQMPIYIPRIGEEIIIGKEMPRSKVKWWIKQ
ncbi:L-ascorbate metabolism protein UlaG, beta-lactamase superfamily [Spirosomataceae bacterium TFI 002]|nr:L-ascorbate metabolism protein UlaG, beta-lactamase superfamily [Spirosomataceae bacterium TFI 002]